MTYNIMKEHQILSEVLVSLKRKVIGQESIKTKEIANNIFEAIRQILPHKNGGVHLQVERFQPNEIRIILTSLITESNSSKTSYFKITVFISIDYEHGNLSISSIKYEVVLNDGEEKYNYFIDENGFYESHTRLCE